MLALTISLGIIGLLLVPVDVQFEIGPTDRGSGKLAIRWLFGLIRVRINLPGEARSEPEKGESATKRKTGGRRMLGLFRQAAFRRRLYRFVRDLIDAVRVRRFEASLRLGLGDPAETGRLWALIWPFNALARHYGINVRFYPDFVDAGFELEAHGRILLIPMQFIVLVIAFVLSPSSLRAWRQVRSGTA